MTKQVGVDAIEVFHTFLKRPTEDMPITIGGLRTTDDRLSVR